MFLDFSFDIFELMAYIATFKLVYKGTFRFL